MLLWHVCRDLRMSFAGHPTCRTGCQHQGGSGRLGYSLPDSTDSRTTHASCRAISASQATWMGNFLSWSMHSRSAPLGSKFVEFLATSAQSRVSRVSPACAQQGLAGGLRAGSGRAVQSRALLLTGTGGWWGVETSVGQTVTELHDTSLSTEWAYAPHSSSACIRKNSARSNTGGSRASVAATWPP